MKIPVYLCAAYRGIKGDQALQEDIEINIQKAKAIAEDIAIHWPHTVHVYTPHTASDLQFFNSDWAEGRICTGDVLLQCLKMVNNIGKSRGILLSIGPESSGMVIEKVFAQELGYRVCRYDEWDDEAKENFAYTVLEQLGE